jgi:CopG family nickel-responsive transcriptional regulator
MENIVRFGVSIEPELLQKYDTMIKEKGYTNRSEALRDLIRNNIVTQDKTNPEANGLGTLTMIYDHHTGPLTKRLLDIQHDNHEEILTTTHIHIDHHHCLEVLVLKGKIQKIKHLADSITALKGIKHGELVLTTHTL